MGCGGFWVRGQVGFRCWVSGYWLCCRDADFGLRWMCWLAACLLLVFVICRLVRRSVCGSYFKAYLMVCCFVLLVCLLTVGCGIWLVFAGFSVVVYLMVAA